ncbi:uncharacterized protein LOC143591653 [Bidens hawaiensis]|uniref:uncharacterized protein LOC143591653 n=1 Tax=Bidens hawaiensis TaxID=980011 RepID=UPI00404B782E
MNTDASCCPKQVGNGFVERGPCGYGGILRDHHGNWVRGFIGYIDEANILTSELHGVLQGLKVLDKLKHKGATLETDNKGVYEWVTGLNDRRQTEIIHESWRINQGFKDLAKKNNITIKHIPGKDANRCADRLADIARMEKTRYREIEHLPDDRELKVLVEGDSNLNN